MNIEKKLIPLLRFPEFQGKGEWTIKKIGEISTSFSGGTPIASTKEYYGGNIPFIRSGEINNDHTTLSLTQMGLDNSSARIVEKGTLLYALYGATSGEVAISKIQGAINQAILAIIPHDDVNVAFIYHYLKKNKENIVSNYIQGGQGNLSSAIINALPIAIPSLIEQQKIAECLSSIDSYISSISEKVEQLKAHKTSLLQKLFPQNGENVPEYRFPEFKELGMWTENTLGDIGDVCMCKRIMKDETNINYSIPFYKIGTFGKKADTYITEEQFNEYKAKYSYPQKGDILFSAAGTIGRYVEFDGEPAYFQDSNIVWIANDETLVCNKFLKYLYSKVQWNIDDGGVVKRLYNDSIKKTSIHIPSMSEQRKIAGCLSSIDEAITLYSEKVISLIEQHKKGLMQQLFPTTK